MFGRKLRTPQAIVRRRKIRVAVSIALVITLALVLWGTIELMRMSSVRIADVEVHGAQALPSDAVTEVVRRELAGTYLGIIPKDNTFLYPRRAIETALLDSFPRIAELSLSRDGMQSLVVTITERQPHALWCGDIVPSVADIKASIFPRCFFLDETGYIFAQAPSYSGTPYHRFFGAIAQSVASGQPFLPEDEYQTLHQFLQELLAADISLYGLLVVDEVELEIYLSDGARLLVRREDEHARVLGRIRSVIVSDEFTAYDTSEIDYIDLRFGGRVYVRPKEIIDQSLKPTEFESIDVSDIPAESAPIDEVIEEVGIATTAENAAAEEITSQEETSTSDTSSNAVDDEEAVE